MSVMDLEYARHNKSPRYVVGALLGWVGIGLALFFCYREVAISFVDLWKVPPGTSLHLMVPGTAVSVLGQFAVVTSTLLGTLCVVLQRGRWQGWVVAAIGVSLAFAAEPLGRWALEYVVAKHGLVDGG